MEKEESTQMEAEKSGAYKSKTGIILFFVFTPVYLTFVILSVLNPSLMATEIGSLNLSVVYGFGLIGFAIILAILYNYLCNKRERGDDVTLDSEEDKQ